MGAVITLIVMLFAIAGIGLALFHLFMCACAFSAVSEIKRLTDKPKPPGRTETRPLGQP